MLSIKSNCENCQKELPNHSSEAMICSFECTFCKDCVGNILANVCPNCGGGFEKRPTRPVHLLQKYPAETKPFFKLINWVEFEKLKTKNQLIQPNKR